jgi:uncharacterized membrane protein YkoI
MKHSLRNLILVVLTALTLAVGYGAAQGVSRTPPQPSQVQTQDHEDEGEEAGENEQEGEDDGEEADDAEGAEERNEVEEADDAPSSSAPGAIGDYGKVSLQDAVKGAQAELGTRNAPFEATLEQVNGTLTWALDFTDPKMQVVLDANTGAVMSKSALNTVPSADAALTSYGSMSLADAVSAAQKAYGSPADVTEIALEKDAKNGNVLTWRIDVGGKLVVLDADSGDVLSIGALN